MPSLWLTHLSTRALLDIIDEIPLSRAANDLYPNGNYEQSKSVFEEVVSKSTSEAASKIATLGLCDIELLTGDMSKTLDTYGQLKEYFAASNDFGGSAFCLKRIGWIHGTYDRFDDASAALAAGLDQANTANDGYSEAFVYYALAMIALKRGDPHESLSLITRCEAIRTNIDDLHGVAAARVGLAKVYFCLRDFGRAMTAMQSSLEIFTTLKNMPCVAAVSTHMSALAADIQAERFPHAGMLPGCSSSDRGASIRDVLGQLTTTIQPNLLEHVSALTGAAGNLPMAIGSRAWPG